MHHLPCTLLPAPPRQGKSSWPKNRSRAMVSTDLPFGKGLFLFSTGIGQVTHHSLFFLFLRISFTLEHIYHPELPCVWQSLPRNQQLHSKMLLTSVSASGRGEAALCLLQICWQSQAGTSVVLRSFFPPTPKGRAAQGLSEWPRLKDISSALVIDLCVSACAAQQIPGELSILPKWFGKHTNTWINRGKFSHLLW